MGASGELAIPTREGSTVTERGKWVLEHEIYYNELADGKMAALSSEEPSWLTATSEDIV
jgi:hypothetical protein